MIFIRQRAAHLGFFSFVGRKANNIIVVFVSQVRTAVRHRQCDLHAAAKGRAAVGRGEVRVPDHRRHQQQGHPGPVPQGAGPARHQRQLDQKVNNPPKLSLVW